MKMNGEPRKGKKGKDFCFICEEYVLNFARHIKRNHSMDTEVQKIFTLPANSKDRKGSLTLLRNKGNFLVSKEKTKPVRQPDIHSEIVPCPNCLGFYSAKQLWRHKRVCAASQKVACHQRNAQNVLLKHLKIDAELMHKVFPRMRADEISLTAKKDPLICAFGSRYIKIHREKHFVHIVSRNMRELARLFLEVKKEDPSFSNLFEVLKPQHFDLLVSSTKKAAKYDVDTDYYGSPSYALRAGTSLKQCCEIAIVYALKRKEIYSTIPAAEAEADLKTLIQLINSHWRFEISNKASSDLRTNQWNKVTIIPLATDLKLLKDYLLKKAQAEIEKLENNTHNIKSYIGLLETIYCRVLLLNRRRPGELQRLSLHLYEKTDNNPQNYEEFSEVVTASEQILLKRFKRVVIRGKRSRGVPVLFSDDVQKHIEVLLRHRDNISTVNNPYLFGNPKTSQLICGYKALRKLVKASGAKNPDAITATRLRKHLATLTQLFNMSENDMEQLAAFMGHTLDVHKGSYRLPDDIYQTAKISKLLILMENGRAGQFKGKKLDDVEIDLNEDLLESTEIEKKSIETMEQLNDDCEKPETSDPVKHPIPTFIKGKRVLVPWTDEQKKVAYDFFARHIEKKIPAKKQDCLTLKQQHPELLRNKDWLKIKVFVQNAYNKKV